MLFYFRMFQMFIVSGTHCCSSCVTFQNYSIIVSNEFLKNKLATFTISNYQFKKFLVRRKIKKKTEIFFFEPAWSGAGRVDVSVGVRCPHHGILRYSYGIFVKTIKNLQTRVKLINNTFYFNFNTINFNSMYIKWATQIIRTQIITYRFPITPM